MISRFTSDKARKHFHQVYDELLNWPVPATDVTVPTSFGPTYLRRSGDPGNPPLLLLPGIFATSLSWQPHVAELSGKYLVYAVDPIGEAGRSEQTAPMTDARAVARWLKETIDGLGHDEVHLMGASRGGWVVLNQAVYEPDRVASVAALDPGGFQAKGLARSFLIAGLLTFAPEFIRKRIKPDSYYAVVNDKITRGILLAQMRYVKKYYAMGKFTEEELSRITVPTTVLLAERSVVLDAYETRTMLHRVNPAVDVQVIPGAAHNLTIMSWAASAVAG
jgi:pimeloyl-ACP methyl ester carboxylesterase